MKSGETFREVVELIRRGEDISQEELVDCCGYAQDGVNELYILLKAFRDGYKAQQETIRRKQVLLEAKIEEIKTKERTIWVLNQKIRKLGGDVQAATVVNGRQIDGPTGDSFGERTSNVGRLHACPYGGTGNQSPTERIGTGNPSPTERIGTGTSFASPAPTERGEG